jgi:hypothetical protein
MFFSYCYFQSASWPASEIRATKVSSQDRREPPTWFKLNHTLTFVIFSLLSFLLNRRRCPLHGCGQSRPVSTWHASHMVYPNLQGPRYQCPQRIHSYFASKDPVSSNESCRFPTYISIAVSLILFPNTRRLHSPFLASSAFSYTKYRPPTLPRTPDFTCHV